MFYKLKNYINYRRENYLINNRYKSIKNKKIIVIGTPNHKNIGDQAIAYAEYKYLRNNFNEYSIVDVTMDEYYRNKNILSKHVKNNDIFVLHGGGNLGNEYIYDENIRRDVIESFKKNKIILFPQTIYFTNDDKGKNELEKSKKIYNSHSDLTLISREEYSYSIMKEVFKNNKVILTPDIVLYLEYNKSNYIRKNALLCLRDDIEKVLSLNCEKELERVLKLNYKLIDITDMKARDNVKGKERKSLIQEKVNQFFKYELVITDRLHGMIFAAITGTPCIALSNYNYKVKGTYEWINHLGYIKFTDDINEIPKLIQELKCIKDISYDNKFVVEKYEQIKECIND